MGEQFKMIEYPLMLLFMVSGAMFLVSTSDLVSMFLLFIYMAHEWLSLANTLALILFNLYMTSTTFFSTVYTGILLKFNTVLSIFPSMQTGSLSKSDCYFFFLYLFAYFWTSVMDIQFSKVGRETRSDGTFVRDVYSMWDLNDSNCMLWLLPPGSYLMVEGAAWHPLMHAYVDRSMLYPISYFTFVHSPLILPGLPPLTPVMLDMPVSLHTLTWYFFLPFFLMFKLMMVYPYDGILM